ncbi:hypothetical protein B6U98_05440 [Thermoplasmatales archaeon ex4572_165]|nr:MAG: hypothetical protein B6U98_05440 [Thermoplasmatales archaeon ex4572_165]RLF58363.1 MAG: hypothetical protein DRN27_05635 [Thermoplasmata archaeon]
MNEPLNPWTSDDEKEHYPSVLEWWCTEGFFKCKKTGKTWSFKGSFSEWCTAGNVHGSTYDFTLFDPEKKKYFSSYIRTDEEKLDISYDEENKIITRFNNAFLTGIYPNYKMRYENIKDDIVLELRYHSESLPHWITQDITGGYLPMGMGFYRYGFIPRNTIDGTLSIKDHEFSVKGTGYYEHVWGDFSYKNPLANLSFLKKSVPIYQKLIAWWIHNHNPKIPNKIRFLSENNPLGYDWLWGILDNGWSFFLGNILFWVSEGPIFGTLILTKDGKHYHEFCDVTYQYKKLEQSKNFDFVYPTDIIINARDKNEKLTLNCKMIMPCREFVTLLNQKKWLAFVICEAPGKITGSYQNDQGKINLSGLCKFEPQRQISNYGHNELSIDFIKPPKGVGIKINLESHFLNKRICSKLCFDPYPKIRFSSKKNKS